jgi:outer membrane protein assembly factor BamB
MQPPSEPTPTRREVLGAAGAVAVGATVGVDVADAQTGEASPGRTWPTFGYDAANTGHNPDTAGPRTDIGSAWNFSPDSAVRSSPTVASIAAGENSSGTTVYVGSSAPAVHAIDAASGDEQWRFGTGQRVQSSPAVVETGGGGTVYVGSDDGFLYAIDAASGEEEWRFETGGPVVSSPTVLDRPGGDSPWVYVGSDDRTVYAVDAETGEEQWSVETQGAVKTTPAAVEPDAGADATGTVYVGSDDGRVYALDAASGGLEWRVGTGSLVRASPVVADGRVYVATRAGLVYALSPADGSEVWQSPFDTGDSVVATPAVADGRLYVPARNRTLYALDTTDGEEVWTFGTGSASAIAAPAVTQETVYVANDSGIIFGVTTDGEERWRFDAGRGVSAPPTVVSTGGESTSGRVYVSTAAGGVGGGGLSALAEGATGPGGGLSGPMNDSQVVGNDSDDLSFLLFPAAIVGFIAAIASGLYAAGRVGLLAKIEATADAYGPDPGEFEAEEDESDGDTTPVWDLVVDDVIARAAQTDRTATEDLLVTKYVDQGTFDAPLVAYEIASYREDPARVRLTEPLFGDREDSRPLGDRWTVADDRLVFEQVLDPDEEIQTIVGRPDCPEDRLDDLLDRPEIAVEDVSKDK